VPHVEDLEKYWVGCMQRGEAWKERVMDVWIAEGGKRTESTPVVERSRWEYPIKGLAWVRSWMLWRCKSRFRVLQQEIGSTRISSLIADPFGPCSQWLSSRKESQPDLRSVKRLQPRRR
jgi:hypothetical protein